jgi:hypothetical protein
MPKCLHVGAAGRSKVCDNKTLCTIGVKHYSLSRWLSLRAGRISGKETIVFHLHRPKLMAFWKRLMALKKFDTFPITH